VYSSNGRRLQCAIAIQNDPSWGWWILGSGQQPVENNQVFQITLTGDASQGRAEQFAGTGPVSNVPRLSVHLALLHSRKLASSGV